MKVMFSIVCNTVKQRDPTRAVVVAVSSQAIFDSDSDTPDLLKKGPAFSFIKAVQHVNETLLEKNPAETLLFDVILLSNDSQENNSRIIASVKHHGLDIGRFCFCNQKDNLVSLQSNKAKLFLSTDKNDVFTALQQGVLSALLYHHSDHQASDQLRVLFSGEALGLTEMKVSTLGEHDFTESEPQSFETAKDAMKDFAVQMGEMRRRFGIEGSPLGTGLMTEWGSRDVCAQALKTLRGWGLMVDEAFCLAGAPPNPILKVVQPHILFIDGLHHTQDTTES